MSLFISFEGCEGAGKTTQVGLLSKWMDDRGIKNVVTKEPGSPHSFECMKIRELLLDPKYDLCPNTELFLLLADRSQHVNFILNALKDGVHVLTDRYIDSTRVYQGIRGFSRRRLDDLISLATADLTPNKTFVLDLPAVVGLDRAKAKSIYKDGDRMEREGIEYHEQVRQGFLKLAESLSEQRRITVINAAPPITIDEVHTQIVEHVSKMLWSGDIYG